MTFNVITTRQPQVVIDQSALTQIQQDLAKRIADLERLRVAIETLAQVNDTQKFAAAAMALCNQLAARWKAERASLGFLKGRYVRLAAMSHTEKFTRQMRLVQDIEASMEECLDQDVEILFPPAAQASYVSRATEALANKHGPNAICLLPLRRASEVVAVLTLERKADQPFNLEEVETLRLTADLVTARLVDLHETDRWMGARLGKWIRKSAALAVGSKHTWIKVAAMAVFGVSAFALLGRTDYMIDAPFTFEAVEKRVIPAPYDGYIKSVRANAGDYVLSEESAGKIKALGDFWPLGNALDVPALDSTLATLDTAELKNKLASAKADRLAELRQADIARRDGKIAEAQVSDANADKIKAQIDLYEYQIGQAVIKMPVDGLVLTGDLKQKLGAPVKTGDELYEVGKLSALRAELQVPEDVVSELLEKGRAYVGTLKTSSYPEQGFHFTVERINPVAEVVEGKNVFKVRVRLEKDSYQSWMRPGMQGNAKVTIRRENYAWLWTHRLLNWVRMKVWLWF